MGDRTLVIAAADELAAMTDELHDLGDEMRLQEIAQTIDQFVASGLDERQLAHSYVTALAETYSDEDLQAISDALSAHLPFGVGRHLRAKIRQMIEPETDSRWLPERFEHFETKRLELQELALGRIATMLVEIEKAQNDLTSAVRYAKVAGCTWKQIGKAAGITAPSAHQRWASQIAVPEEDDSLEEASEQPEIVDPDTP